MSFATSILTQGPGAFSIFIFPTQEFRTVNTYNTVIEVCAGGANKVTEIADKAHITTATLAYVLKSLDTVGVISKITPMTEKENNRRSVYEVTDNMYRFWYSFIPGAKAAIEMEQKTGVFKYDPK